MKREGVHCKRLQNINIVAVVTKSSDSLPVCVCDPKKKTQPSSSRPDPTAKRISAVVSQASSHFTPNTRTDNIFLWHISHVQ